jgi:hypothetical protein
MKLTLPIGLGALSVTVLLSEAKAIPPPNLSEEVTNALMKVRRKKDAPTSFVIVLIST